MIHRLLCCSDTHGSVPPAVVDPDAIAWLHAGDLCRAAEAPDLYSDSNPLEDPILAPVSQWFAKAQVPTFFVQGNHDVVDLYHARRWASDITGRIIPIADHLYIAGVGWHGERYFELLFEADLRRCCDSIMRQARQLTSRDWLVLLTHYPPRYSHTHDVPNDQDGGGVWYDCVRQLADELNVVAVVQGHNHRWFGDTSYVAAANRRVLLTNPGPQGCRISIHSETGHAEIQPL